MIAGALFVAKKELERTRIARAADQHHERGKGFWRLSF